MSPAAAALDRALALPQGSERVGALTGAFARVFEAIGPVEPAVAFYAVAQVALDDMADEARERAS